MEEEVKCSSIHERELCHCISKLNLRATRPAVFFAGSALRILVPSSITLEFMTGSELHLVDGLE